MAILSETGRPMFLNFLKITLRKILRERYYTVVQVLGLAVGLASALFIARYVLHETSYDNFHPDVADTYRVNQTNIWNASGGIMSSTSPPLAAVLLQDYPEIEKVLRINTAGTYVIDNGDNHPVYQENVLAADSTFFSFFGFKLMEGDPSTALKGPNKVILSQALARKYFGTNHALGKTLLEGPDKRPLLVTGVFEPFPDNAHFSPDFLVSMETNPDVQHWADRGNWIWSQVVTYIRVHPGTDIKALQRKLVGVRTDHLIPGLVSMHINYEEFMQGKGDWTYTLQPVRDIHLYSTFIGNRLGDIGSIQNVIIIGTLGIFILALALINFVNLSTARAGARLKEIGLRKVVGSSRALLATQFLVECVVLCLLAMTIAFFLTNLTLEMLNGVGQTRILLFDWSTPWFLVTMILTPFVIGFLAGIYPALYLSGLKPLFFLRSSNTTGGNRSFRNALVTLQLSISTAMLSVTFIVHNQIAYASSQDLGFDDQNVLLIDHAEKLGNQLNAFKTEALKQTGVESGSIAMAIPGSEASYEDVFQKPGDNAQTFIAMFKSDDDFVPVLNLRMLSGRNLRKDDPADNNSIIINETAAEILNWSPQDALGKKLDYFGDSFEVIGVVKDFHFKSLREKIEPAAILSLNAQTWGDQRTLILRVGRTSMLGVIQKMNALWNEHVNDAPFEYSFLDKTIGDWYNQERQFGSVTAVFTGIAFLITIAGLVSLVSYTVERRQKEIGVRKVLGATTASVMLLINSNYVRLYLIAFVLAVPASWFAMNKWLSGFSYHMTIGALLFIGIGGITMLIMLLSNSYLTFKASSRNPSEIIRYE